MPGMSFSTTLLAACVGCAFAGAALGEESNSASGHSCPPTHYYVVELPTFGGSSRADGITANGWVSGYSLHPDSTRTAALWAYGALTDLGTLGGPSSAVVWPVKNSVGLLSGVSYTAVPDPKQENWPSCAAFLSPASTNTCRGFVWEAGQMRALPLLSGGNNSFATGTNNHRLTVGWSETGWSDPTCTGFICAPPHERACSAVSPG